MTAPKSSRTHVEADVSRRRMEASASSTKRAARAGPVQWKDTHTSTRGIWRFVIRLPFLFWILLFKSLSLQMGGGKKKQAKASSQRDNDPVPSAEKATREERKQCVLEEGLRLSVRRHAACVGVRLQRRRNRVYSCRTRWEHAEGERERGGREGAHARASEGSILFRFISVTISIERKHLKVLLW